MAPRTQVPPLQKIALKLVAPFVECVAYSAAKEIVELSGQGCESGDERKARLKKFVDDFSEFILDRTNFYTVHAVVEQVQELVGTSRKHARTHVQEEKNFCSRYFLVLPMRLNLGNFVENCTTTTST